MSDSVGGGRRRLQGDTSDNPGYDSPQAPAPSLTKYHTIVADPPWHYGRRMIVTGNAPGRKRPERQSGIDYNTLSIAQISALPIGDLVTSKAHLYLWTTNEHVRHAWNLVEGWGFRAKTLLTWCKRPKGMIGFGVFSPASEFVLFASRGKASYKDRSESTWFEWPRGRHSAKPEAFFDLVERVTSPAAWVGYLGRRGVGTRFTRC